MADPATQTTAQTIVKDIPRFIIPDGAIQTAGQPAVAAPPAEKPAAPAEATALAAAPKPAESAPATPPASEIPASEKATTGKDPESEKPEEKRASRSYERRIDRATKAMHEQRIAREAAEKRAAELEAQIAASKADPNEPKADQFTDVEEYAKAKADYALKKVEREREQSTRAESQKKEEARLTEQWQTAVDTGEEKYPDFHDVVGDLRPTTPWGVAIMEADNAADVAYHLGKNVKEVERIAALSPRQQFLEIGKLSAKLAAQPEAPKKPSAAPKPIEPVSGGAVVAENDPFKPQPFEQYMKSRPKLFDPRHH